MLFDIINQRDKSFFGPICGSFQLPKHVTVIRRIWVKIIKYIITLNKDFVNSPLIINMTNPNNKTNWTVGYIREPIVYNNNIKPVIHTKIFVYAEHGKNYFIAYASLS